MATIKDVAKYVGLSVSSVSRALSGSDAIGGEKKEQILEAAKLLGYSPNLLARNLKNSKSLTIGLIISNIDNSFYLTIAKVIEEEIKKYGYSLILAYSNDNGEDERKNIELFAGTQVAGIIFTPIAYENRALIERVSQQKIALVQLFRCMYKDVNSVIVDDAKGARLAVTHLLENGHRQILMLDIDSPYGSKRSSGYIESFHDKSLAVDDRLIVNLPNSRLEAEALIAKSIKELKPTAVVAGVNFAGKVAIQYCKENRIKIPEDISMIVFDDVEWNYMLDVTSVAQPVEYIGLSACRILMDEIESKKLANQPINMNIEPNIVVRQTVKKIV